MATSGAPPLGVTVLYGSQTGTAQDVAERVAREADQRGLVPTVSALDDFDVRTLVSQQVVVFVVATTGQGEEPLNMKRFWRFLLRRALPATSLQSVLTAVFGLGDSTYPKFNFVAKKLHKRLAQLGALSVCGLGLADDQHALGVDGALDPWLEGLWGNLCTRLSLPLFPDAHLQSTQRRASPRYIISTIGMEPTTDSVLTSQGSVILEASSECPRKCAILENRRITAEDHFQDVRHITLANSITVECEGSASIPPLKYEPGDVLYVRPRNPPDAVAEVAAYFGLAESDPLTIAPGLGVPKNSSLPWPFRCGRTPTVREVLEQYLDIRAVPRRYFFELLSTFAADPREADRLRELASAEGLDDLLAYCNRVRRTSVEVLRDFPSAARAHDLVKYLLDFFRPMQPRAFSIASAAQVKPDRIEIAAAIVQYKTRMLALRVGVCTSWLATLDPKAADTADVWIERGTFRVPHWSTPLVMVGPGTGCAPFRACIQARSAAAKDAGSTTTNVLFFGNRKQHGDFLFGEEWGEYQASGALSLFTAFSRDQPAKIYVQHRIKEQGKLLWDLISSQGATLLVAGSSKRMPTDVRMAFMDVVAEHGRMRDDNASIYLDKMERESRLQFETW